MFFKTSVAAFYIPGTDYNSRALAEKAGMTEIQPLDEDEMKGFGEHFSSRAIFYGQWREFGDTWVKTDILQGFTCLQLYFSMNTFFDKVNVDDADAISETDNRSPMTAAFAFACGQLRPQVAYVDIKSHFENEDWENNLGNSSEVLSYISLISERNIAALCRENFWLLYLSDLSGMEESKVNNNYRVTGVESGKLLISR